MYTYCTLVKIGTAVQDVTILFSVSESMISFFSKLGRLHYFTSLSFKIFHNSLLSVLLLCHFPVFLFYFFLFKLNHFCFLFMLHLNLVLLKNIRQWILLYSWLINIIEATILNQERNRCIKPYIDVLQESFMRIKEFSVNMSANILFHHFNNY